ncbi:helix-turn-helix domain-containing protein [Pseudomonas putida]|uniref:helix-turn-helix domain-containing protein n=1 Tax=Pseudomonas putida TaxID=303 RepID=UPI001576B694|nr:helix-turn-helix domain-containing protein [Pseudomonas putida]NTY91958.1 helix-turn-helix domain-containing protein [Pseudomonas putida]NTY99546.1 helix-turn-helix domain-containing protein [Pseudomonas putida]NTZ22079.1 helix-turn-helix domain-containing protein [Pseudomonas putida]NTZ55634.1 helix-turn-helix domain-containing protein [Pseudomonas putida]NTZ65555.1 helix-turn-helix domain-containing protein [Pseudomonas putida]
MTIQEMLQKLIELGFSQRAIADRVGVTQPTIYRATKGAAVRYEVGKAIELFYEEQQRLLKNSRSKDD